VCGVCVIVRVCVRARVFVWCVCVRKFESWPARCKHKGLRRASDEKKHVN